MKYLLTIVTFLAVIFATNSRPAIAASPGHAGHAGHSASHQPASSVSAASESGIQEGESQAPTHASLTDAPESSLESNLSHPEGDCGNGSHCPDCFTGAFAPEMCSNCYLEPNSAHPATLVTGVPKTDIRVAAAGFAAQYDPGLKREVQKSGVWRSNHRTDPQPRPVSPTVLRL